MTRNASIKITYWAMPNSEASVEDLGGIDDFRRELDEDFVTNVRSSPAGLGGGFYELAVEIVSNLTLLDFLSFIAQGVAFDLIKSGTKALVLRPFLNAYKRLKERNRQKRVDIQLFSIVFQDTTIVVYKILDDSIFGQMERILNEVATHSPNLTLQHSERPTEIHIPVFPDPSPDRLSRFRVKFEIEEEITSITKKDYFKYWGLYYDFAQFRVYDVAKSLLIDSEFHTEERHSRDWQQRHYSRELDKLKRK